MTTFVEILIALLLFAIFERKRFPVWRAKAAAIRSSRLQARSGRALVARLDAAGFFDGLTSQETHFLRSAIATHGYGAVFEHPWRAFEADDEELAEGQVSSYLQSWAPSLARLGVAPLLGESRFLDGGAHILEMPRETVTLVSDDEAREDEPAGKMPGFSWGAVGARLLQRLNQDLAASGHADRLYSVYGGNDARVLLLTPPMLAAIVTTPGLRSSELPYLRTAQWPHFGNPQ